MAVSVFPGNIKSGVFPVPLAATPQATVTSTTGSPTIDTTTRAGKTIYIFNGSGSITVGTAGTAEVLIIAGGGGGGPSQGGAGGAGGYIYNASILLNAGTQTITVGAGSSNNGRMGILGNPSSIGVPPIGYTAIGGGGGGYGSGDDATGNGMTGGSGGGGGFAGSRPGAGGQLSQGNSGSAGNGSQGGSGGGAGGNASGTTGGVGLASTITGTSVTRGGGGGYSTASGGGGGGFAVAGTANTGGGGGFQGTGGSGVVIIVTG
jgi:hypothetical protein